MAREAFASVAPVLRVCRVRYAGTPAVAKPTSVRLFSGVSKWVDLSLPAQTVTPATRLTEAGASTGGVMPNTPTT